MSQLKIYIIHAGIDCGMQKNNFYACLNVISKTTKTDEKGSLKLTLDHGFLNFAKLREQ